MRWEAEGSEKIVRDFANLNSKGSGYVIEGSEEGFRWCFIEPGIPLERSRWVASEGAAIRAASEDWDAGGSLYEYPTYLPMLRREATKAEKRENG